MGTAMTSWVRPLQLSGHLSRDRGNRGRTATKSIFQLLYTVSVYYTPILQITILASLPRCAVASCPVVCCAINKEESDAKGFATFKLSQSLYFRCNCYSGNC